MKKSFLALTTTITVFSIMISYVLAENNNEHSKHKEHNMEVKVHKPTQELIIDGVKATFYIIDLNKSKQTMNNIKGDSVYSGSMHPYVISNKEENCYICGMKLTKEKKSDIKLNDDKFSHHMEVYFTNNKTGEMYSDVQAKVKIIHPDKKSNEYDLKSNFGYFGSGINLHHKGKHGIITLFKINDEKRVAKFYFDNNSSEHKH